MSIKEYAEGAAMIVGWSLGISVIGILLDEVLKWIGGGCKFSDGYSPAYHPPVSQEYKDEQKRAFIRNLSEDIVEIRAGGESVVRQRRTANGTHPSNIDEVIRRLSNIAEYPGAPEEVAECWVRWQQLDWGGAMGVKAYDSAHPNWLALTLEIRAVRSNNIG
jgi:hypothetical protein